MHCEMKVPLSLAPGAVGCPTKAQQAPPTLHLYLRFIRPVFHRGSLSLLGGLPSESACLPLRRTLVRLTLEQPTTIGGPSPPLF